MSVLLDTNILQRGEVMCIVPQNLYEFWVVETRPLSANGMGMSPPQAETELLSLKELFRFLNDTPHVYTEWERLVSQYAVSGKPAHDTRLVAAMSVHSLTQILTFNVDDFKRFSTITVLSPSSVLQQQRTTLPTNN